MSQAAEQPSSLPGLSDTRLEEIEKLGITAGAYGDPIDHDNNNVAECTRCKIGVAFSDLLAEVRRLQQQAEAHAQAAQSWGDAEAAYKLALRTERERYNTLLDQLASAREETAQAVREEIEACARLAAPRPEMFSPIINAERARICDAIRARSRSLPGETADA